MRIFGFLCLVATLAVATACGTDDTSAQSGNATTPNGSPTATLETSEGTIVIDLATASAPESAQHFADLATEGFYDGLSFHRASAGFVIQGGDPNGDGTGGPDETIIAETPPDGYRVGSVAWAKTQVDPPGAAGSQFFIVTSDGPGLQRSLNATPYQYGYIGEVVQGIEVAQAIEALAPPSGDGPPTTPVTIERVTITEG